MAIALQICHARSKPELRTRIGKKLNRFAELEKTKFSELGKNYLSVLQQL